MSENRLGKETSPYLIQHQANPVHWWAWGPEALAEAQRTGKPILLSVGYAACHWCHVMAHESFEDDTTAEVMNRHFVNIKVDREERPDIDAIYMTALHRLGEQGGWPLTMFLTPDARPFFGGTYFPKVAQWGRPSFVDVLTRVDQVFHDEPEKVEQNAQAIMASLKPVPADDAGTFRMSDPLLRDLATRMTGAIDPEHGGIRGAPKFPQWSFFWLLWRAGIRLDSAAARVAVETTLRNICQGGIYDHLGGGFARYSVDERWLAPHFEKMLYDNALLIDLLTEVFRETQEPLFKVRIQETVTWLEREMIAEGGGFAASLDADSEGEEGKFYVWTAAEVLDVLGPEDAAFFGRAYDVTAEGNWEGHTILNRLATLHLGSAADETRLQALREKLLARRAGRIRPGWDDKVLADWNGLMIGALARAARVFAKPKWLAMTERAFAFVEERMSAGAKPEGDRLWHSYRDGRAKAPATASDYANMIHAALRLHQATLKPNYLERALAWTGVLDRHYWVDDAGGYATAADDTSDVIVRLRGASDDAVPNANGIMVANLAALGLVTGDQAFHSRAEAIVAAFAGDLRRNLFGHTGLLAAAIDTLAPQLVVIAGSPDHPADNLAAILNGVSMSGATEYVVVDGAVHEAPAGLRDKSITDEKSTGYVCVGPACSRPVHSEQAFVAELRRQRCAVAAA